MLLACLPFGPCVTSKETFWPSLSVLKPGILIAEKCAKRSSPPPSGVMKPKPLASLNHLTVPVAILCCPKKIKKGLSPNRVKSLSPQERTTIQPCFQRLKPNRVAHLIGSRAGGQALFITALAGIRGRGAEGGAARRRDNRRSRACRRYPLPILQRRCSSYWYSRRRCTARLSRPG